MGCNPHDDYARKFNIINKSDSAIYFALSNSYPDTNLSKVNAIPYNKGIGVFNLNTTTLVFIFDAHTIETTPWNSIVKHNIKAIPAY